MTLDGFGACGLVSIVELGEKLWFDKVTRIQHNGNVVELELGQVVDCQL